MQLSCRRPASAEHAAGLITARDCSAHRTDFARANDWTAPPWCEPQVSEHVDTLHRSLVTQFPQRICKWLWHRRTKHHSCASFTATIYQNTRERIHSSARIFNDDFTLLERCGKRKIQLVQICRNSLQNHRLGMRDAVHTTFVKCLMMGLLAGFGT